MVNVGPEIGEKAVLSQLRDGSYEAFEYIYHRYKVRLAASMLRLLKSTDLVDDLLQELFVRLWEHRESINPEQPIKAYLFRIAENLVYDTFRRLSKDRRLQDQLFHAMEEIGADIEKQFFMQEDRQAIEAVIAMLPPKRRQVFTLCKLESKSYEEVSSLLNISLSTVNDHIYKANQFLKQHLADHMVSLFSIVIQTALLTAW
ncbi:DNA-directed RNA polymerase sigma-70 factor [Parapedobacter defluvii]|uniref:DNA-directed RNA polymerase sigma-70 factor n=1 Tax=Parapedobacter defluvii TaxID=2045106 RepID=A0ABQ1L4P4_9SPHI|nr:RNA polymerase sigma-70 factor [Parapedobacter defluvii]GGC17051.1 DNA-directed RNA polymerase sigma-70 factor [Parapedobacter defluvii]